MKYSEVRPKPGQSMEEALRTAPVIMIDQRMFLNCPHVIMCFKQPGSEGAHYDATGHCDCERKEKLKAALRGSRRVGWCPAEGGKWSHLIVRPELTRTEAGTSENRVVCGLDIELLRPERTPKPEGGSCVKCRAYAAKRRWLP